MMQEVLATGPQTGPSEMVGGYVRSVTGQKSMVATSIATSAAFSHVLGKGGGSGGILGIISKKARGGGGNQTSESVLGEFTSHKSYIFQGISFDL